MLLAVPALVWGLWPRADSSAPGAQASESRPQVTLTLSIAAEGKPVAGAEVGLAGEHCRRSGRSDDAGELEFVCPPGHLQLTVAAKGYARERRALELRANSLDERVELAPGARVRGVVRDDNQRPVPSATVTARVLGPAPIEPWTTLSAEDGTFQFETLPLGSIALEIADGGAHETITLAELALPAEALEVVLRRTAAISGTVLDPFGRPASARVTLAGSGVWPARSSKSDASGAFEFALVPEGVYEIRAETDSAVSATLEGVQVQPGSRAQIEVSLQPAAALSGKVCDAASGHALAGAELEVVEESLSASDKRVRSNPDGSFNLGGLRAVAHRVTIRAHSYVTDQRWLTPGAAPSAIGLLRAARLRGRVEDAAGRPVSLAELEVTGRSVTGFAVNMLGPVQEAPLRDPLRLSAGDPGNLGVTSSVPRIPLAGPLPGGADDLGFRADANGDFDISGLPPGQLRLTARKAGYGTGHSATLRVTPGATLDDVVVSMQRGERLSGRVFDNRGPVPHVRVDLASPGEPVRSTTTLANGSFSFEGARGECTLSARPPHAPPVKQSGLAEQLALHEIILTLEKATDRLLGRVLDPQGQPLESAGIELEARQAHGFHTTAITARDGTFELTTLPAPPYSVNVEHPDYLPVRGLRVEDTAKPLSVKLEVGTGIAGLILDAYADTPLSGVELRIQAGGLTRVARTGRDGKFEFRHLPQGHFALTAEADRFIPERRSGQLEATTRDTPELRITLTRGGSISGDVVDGLGSTVWNAEVAPGSPPRWEHAARTDHAGHFTLRGLAAGPQTLTARHLTQSVELDAPVKVIAGEDTPGVVLRLPEKAPDEGEVEDAPRRSGGSSGSGRGSAPVSFGLRGGAVVVERVSPDSAADRSGLMSGDVLLSVNGEPVRSAAQARGMLAPILGRDNSCVLVIRRDAAVLRLQYSTR